MVSDGYHPEELQKTQRRALFDDLNTTLTASFNAMHDIANSLPKEERRELIEHIENIQRAHNSLMREFSVPPR